MTSKEQLEKLISDIRQEAEEDIRAVISKMPAEQLAAWILGIPQKQTGKVGEINKSSAALPTPSRGNIVTAFHEILKEFPQGADNRTVRERFEQRTGIKLNSKQASNYLSYLVGYGKAGIAGKSAVRGNLYKAE